MAGILDVMARRIFEAAIAEDRCGELLEALFHGGTATVDTRTGQLVILPASGVTDLMRSGS